MRSEISLREANQHLSRYINAVEHGDEVIITRRGEQIAILTGMKKKRSLSPTQEEALNYLQEHMKKGYSLGGKKFNRDEAHER